MLVFPNVLWEPRECPTSMYEAVSEVASEEISK